MGKHEAFACIMFVIVIISISLFGSSFAVLELNKVGIKKDKFSVKIDETSVYRPGRLI